MPRTTLRWQVCAIFLRKRYLLTSTITKGAFIAPRARNRTNHSFFSLVLFAVLLRALLGHNPLEAGQGVPQAAGQRGCRPAEGRAIPLVLTLERLVQRPNKKHTTRFSLLPYHLMVVVVQVVDCIYRHNYLVAIIHI